MNVVEGRELLQYGFRLSKNYDLAMKMLKSYKFDEFKNLSSTDQTLSEPPVFASRFCRIPNYEHVLALANEDGKIGIQNTNSLPDNAPARQITCRQAHRNAIFDLSWSDSALRLVSVSGDHSAVLWDISDLKIEPLGMFAGHNRSVKVAAFRPHDANVFATGGRDGVVIVWDYRCSQIVSEPISAIKPDNVILNAHCQPGSTVKRNKKKEISRADSITGLAYQNDNFLISCSAGDGIIKVWDMRKCYSTYRRLPQPSYSMPHPGGSAKNGFTSLSVDPNGIRLYANCLDNNIYSYNISTYEKLPVATYHGHQNQTFYIKSCLSSDGLYLLSGSSDEKAYLWNVKKPGPPLVQLMGHSAEVTCIDWANNSDGEIKLVTCADDACHRLWRINPPRDSEDQEGLVGWAEMVDRSCNSNMLTPYSIKRMVRQQHRTPECSAGDAKRQKIEEDCAENQQRSVLAVVQPRSEGKGSRRLFDLDSPSQSSSEEPFSPTSNLPNYVLEGTSPYHKCTSSASKQKENWLVKLQSTPSPKQPNKSALKKRSNLQTTPKACGNLLKFFRVSAKQAPMSPEVQKEINASCLSSESPSLLS